MKKFLILLLVLSSISAFPQIQAGQDILGSTNDDSFGNSVDISEDGNIIVIGSASSSFMGANGAGKIRAYQFNGSNWVQLGSDIFGIEEDEVFGIGFAISSDGTKIAGSARFNDEAGMNAGKVRIFEYDGNDWVQLGNSLLGEETTDQFGQVISLSADGTRIAVASPFSNGDGSDTGVSRIFQYDGTSWNQLGEDIIGEAPGDTLGRNSIALSSDGTTVASSSDTNDQGGTNTGNVLVHRYDGTEWVQLGSDIDGTSNQDGNRGIYVALSADGNRVAIGAPGNQDGQAEIGQVRVFELINGQWEQLGTNLYGDEAFDWFGQGVSLSGDGEYLSVCSNTGDSSLQGEVSIFRYTNGDWLEVTTIDGDGSGFKSMTFNEDGEYIIVGSRNFNSTGRVRAFSLSEVLSLDSVSQSSDILIYPNPTERFVTIETHLPIKEVKLYSYLGASFPVSLNGKTIDLGNISNGVYILKLKTTQGVIAKKVVLSKD